jgi:microcystin-dependent protein
MEPFIGQIQMFGFNFPPRGWAFCDGQLLPVAQNTALFSLLGTTYGGDGRTTFALPDLRSRVAIHQGQGPGLSSRRIGERSGLENTSLNVANMPAHTHVASDPQMRATANPANTTDPSNAALAIAPAYNDSSPAATGMDASSIEHPQAGSAGSGTATNNMQPYLTINFCIALVGIFPSRN